MCFEFCASVVMFVGGILKNDYLIDLSKGMQEYWKALGLSTTVFRLISWHVKHQIEDTSKYKINN